MSLPTFGSDLGDSTGYTATTPPESVTSGLQDGFGSSGTTQPSSPVPRPGSTYLIKSAMSREVITLFEGQVVLALPDGRASQWRCISDNGWLGFRNVTSGRFLGHDKPWRLCCEQMWHREWERFQVRERGAGGVLVMKDWSELLPIGMRAEKLSMIKNWESQEIIWEFIQV